MQTLEYTLETCFFSFYNLSPEIIFKILVIILAGYVTCATIEDRYRGGNSLCAKKIKGTKMAIKKNKVSTVI